MTIKQYDHWRSHLRQHGLKMTPGRLSILLALSADSTPKCLSDLVDYLAGNKGCDPSTLYRNLEHLTNAGLLEEIPITGEKKSFFALRPCNDISAHHHHIVCKQCKKVEHIDLCIPVSLMKKVERETGYHLTDHQLEFYGTCQSCR